MNSHKRNVVYKCSSLVVLCFLFGCGRVYAPTTLIPSGEDTVLNGILDTTIVGVFGIIEGRRDKELGIDGRDNISFTLRVMDGPYDKIWVPVGLWFYRASVAAKKEIGAVKCVPIFIDSHVAARSMVIQVRDMGERVDCEISASFRDVLTLICQRCGGLQWRIANGAIIVEDAPRVSRH